MMAKKVASSVAFTFASFRFIWTNHREIGGGGLRSRGEIECVVCVLAGGTDGAEVGLLLIKARAFSHHAGLSSLDQDAAVTS